MKIKSTIVMAAAAGAACAPNAQAADLPAKAPQVTTFAPAWSWTGFYVGGHVGYGWQKNGTSGAYVDGPVFPFDHASNPAGVLGGGQIGYNWQYGSLIYGVEADVSVLSGSGTSTTFLDGGDATATSHNRIQWLGTLRGRLGFAVAPRTMIYGTGGLAYGEVEHNHTLADADGNTALWSSSKIKTGYAAGGGVEHAVLNNVTLRLEGLYVDLGDTTFATQTSGVCSDPPCRPVTFSNKATLVRGGINVKF